MKRTTLALLLVGAGGFAGLLLAWPRINDVETGRTPEYPDLQPRVYNAAPAVVAKAAQTAIANLPRWEFVGAGQGPGGGEIQAIATSRVFRFNDDVTVRVRSEGGKTRVSVRSKSRVGTADFGQNARNIRLFLAELDRQVQH
jgi:uncharacterized protein (DUF1499 family)